MWKVLIRNQHAQETEAELSRDAGNVFRGTASVGNAGRAVAPVGKCNKRKVRRVKQGAQCPAGPEMPRREGLSYPCLMVSTWACMKEKLPGRVHIWRCANPRRWRAPGYRDSVAMLEANSMNVLIYISAIVDYMDTTSLPLSFLLISSFVFLLMTLFFTGVRN